MDLNRLLDEKQPPAGGLFQLRGRIRRHGRRRHIRRQLAYVLAFAATVFASFLFFRPYLADQPGTDTYTDILPVGATALGLTKPTVTDAVSSDPNAAMISVFDSEKVVIYQYVAIR